MAGPRIRPAARAIVGTLSRGRALPAALGLLLALAAGQADAGGGWVPAGKSWYLESSLLYAETNDAYDPDGERVPFRRFGDIDRSTTYRDLALVVFGELGLGGGFAVEGDVAFKRVSVVEPATRFTTSGPADLRLQLKRGVRAGPWALALSAGARLPLGYDEFEYPALGSSAVDGVVMAHAGLGFRRGWAQAEAGLRQRGGPARNEWPFALQGGLHLTPRWSAAIDLRGHGLLSEVTETRLAVVTPELFDPARASSSVVSAGPGLTFAPAPAFRISAQAWRTLAGRNMPAGWKWKLALARVG